MADDITFGAIALDRTAIAGKTGMVVKRRDLLNREGILSVVAYRGWPRLVGVCRTLLSLVVVAHGIDNNAARRGAGQLSPAQTGEGSRRGKIRPAI